MSGDHPMLSFFGRHSARLPRILVIGQEPNINSQVGGHDGLYDLGGSSASKTTFWTWSHKAVERAAGIPGLQLWRTSKDKGSSPIAYADASPKGFKVGGDGKKPQVTRKEFESHADRFIGLVRRKSLSFPVVVVSGRRKQDAPFFEKVLPYLKQRGSVIVKVPFYGRAPGSTRETLAGPLCDPGVRPVIKQVVKAWLDGDQHLAPVHGGGKPEIRASRGLLRAVAAVMQLLAKRRA